MTATDPVALRARFVELATELLMAAITFRDIAEALPPDVLATCPPDILNRMTSCRYQAAFNALPPYVQIAARAQVLADPNVIAARQIHLPKGACPMTTGQMSDPATLLRQAADVLEHPQPVCGCGVAPDGATPGVAFGCCRECMEPVPHPLEEACPGIAEPLAAWLRREASEIQPDVCADECCTVVEALDLARAILGEER